VVKFRQVRGWKYDLLERLMLRHWLKDLTQLLSMSSLYKCMFKCQYTSFKHNCVQGPTSRPTQNLYWSDYKASTKFYIYLDRLHGETGKMTSKYTKWQMDVLTWFAWSAFPCRPRRRWFRRLLRQRTRRKAERPGSWRPGWIGPSPARSAGTCSWPCW